jgi:hypothetical protein
MLLDIARGHWGISLVDQMHQTLSPPIEKKNFHWKGHPP